MLNTKYLRHASKVIPSKKAHQTIGIWKSTKLTIATEAILKAILYVTGKSRN